MNKEQKALLFEATPFCIGGLIMLGLVFFTPNAGRQESLSFFEVARQSPWSSPGDWASAWCSLKIILLSLGVMSFIFWIWTIFAFTTSELLHWVLVLLSAVPGVGLLAGGFFLLKALL